MTRSQLKALGWTTQGLTRVATVLSFGKAIPVYDASDLLKDLPETRRVALPQ
ncbi:hypothetical protein [Deinococcus misasensis]|uniref:hypothetical protein n=1 Tax=Deinococcus misasensis TaxID=392413 RepID=UPI0012F70FB8|nr:hypothetical protein [Deinococcus misasensis]